MTEKPRVKPNAIFGAILFALIFTVGYLYYPQIEMLLPFGGQEMNIETSIASCSVKDLCDNATDIVIAKIGGKLKNQQLQSQTEGQQYIVFSEVTLEVAEVLKGNPALTDENTMTTYELGGSVLMNQGGRDVKFKFVYADAATLQSGSTYMLFLDSEGAILNEKYGALLQTNTTYYRDAYQNVHTYEEILTYLDKEGT